MARTFRKRGLRRDKNFADIPNRQLALNNLLNGLIQTEDDRFVSADLDVIRGLSATTMTNEDVRNIDDAAFKGVDPTDPLAVYEPIITLQNRFDESRFTIGDPQFFGGDGLTTRYFTSGSVDLDSTTYEDIIVGSPEPFENDDGDTVTSEIFWENGQYTFIGLLDDTLSSGFGCIEWNGYFRPSISGVYRFETATTGLFSFEFNAHGPDTVPGVDAITLKRTHPYLSNVTCDVADGAPGALVQEQDQFGDDVLNQILIGDIVVGSTAPFNDPENNPVTVEDVDYEDRIVTFSAPYSGATTDTVDFEFRHEYGQEGTYDIDSDTLIEFQAYPVRIRYMWIPAFTEDLNPTLEDENRFDMFLTPPFSGQIGLDYRFLYSENYDLNPTAGDENSGDFYEFVQQSVPRGGTRIILNDDGSIGTEVGFSGYQNVITKGNLVLEYEPPQNYSSAVYSKDFSYDQGVPRLRTGNTDGVEPGNLVIGPNIPDGTVVTEVSINRAIFINQPPTADGSSETIYFCDHKGLKFFDTSVSFSSGSNSITNVSSTTDINPGDVVVCFGTESTTNWTVVDSVGATSITTSQNLTQNVPSDPQDFVLVYYDNGLEDLSLSNFCSLNPSDPLCSPPEDTSPPFVATEDGLRTKSSHPSILVDSTDSEIKFVDLFIEGGTTNSVSVSDTYNTHIPITDGLGNSYKILAKT